MLHRSFTCYSSFYFVLAVLRENIGLSVGQFVQFWPVVLFFFLLSFLSFSLLSDIRFRSVSYELPMLFIKFADILFIQVIICRRSTVCPLIFLNLGLPSVYGLCSVMRHLLYQC